MRDAFVRSLCAAAERDASVMLLTGDLGFGVINDYRERFPRQFLNIGVAEQNLASLAAGLAMTGHKVLTYSIANFPILRCLEQLRNDVCYHEASVIAVSVGGGMAYGALGPSHFATEDLAIMRALPNMTVVAPGDPHEVDVLLPQLLERSAPAYLRLGRAGEPNVHAADASVVLGRPTAVAHGVDVCVLATGGMLPVARDAVSRLAESHGISASLFSVHTLAPVDRPSLVEACSGHRAVVTVEEHTLSGGLGGMVAEVLMDAGAKARLHRIGLPPGFPSAVGSQEHLRTVYGLDADALVERITSFVGR